jgi:gamma-glutamyl phosphate reductase
MPAQIDIVEVIKTIKHVQVMSMMMLHDYQSMLIPYIKSNLISSVNQQTFTKEVKNLFRRKAVTIDLEGMEKN